MSELIFRGAGIPVGGVCAEVDPEIYFPDRGGSTRAAKKLCVEACEVTDECLDGALERKERFGVWGGKSERELRKLGKLATS